MKLEGNSLIAEVGGRFVWERYVGGEGEIAWKEGVGGSRLRGEG